MITTPSERAAAYLIMLFEKGLLGVPPAFEVGVHSDGTTKVYQTPKDGPVVPFLGLDEVQVIEKVLSKAMWNFVATELPQEMLAQALRRRFESQLACSTCQELGIERPEVKELVDLVLGL